jgi:hypothetical protein
VQPPQGSRSLGTILNEDTIFDPLPSYVESRLSPRCEEDLRNPAPSYVLKRTAPLPSGADKLAGFFVSETRRMVRKVSGWVIICLGDNSPVSTVVAQGITHKRRAGHKRNRAAITNGGGGNRDMILLHVQIGMESRTDEVGVRNRETSL